MLVPVSHLTSVVVRCRGFRQSCTVVDTVSKDLSPPLVGQLCFFSFAPFHFLAICVHDCNCSCPVIHSGLKGSWQQSSDTVLFHFFHANVWRGNFVWLLCCFQEDTALKEITFLGLQKNPCMTYYTFWITSLTVTWCMLPLQQKGAWVKENMLLTSLLKVASKQTESSVFFSSNSIVLLTFVVLLCVSKSRQNVLSGIHRQTLKSKFCCSVKTGLPRGSKWFSKYVQMNLFTLSWVLWSVHKSLKTCTLLCHFKITLH